MKEPFPAPATAFELPSPGDPASVALCKLAHNHGLRAAGYDTTDGMPELSGYVHKRFAAHEQFWAACLHALETLARIGQRYHENTLDDEARKTWGPNDEHTNSTPPDRIELYTGRGGGTLLTLADCLAALHAYNGGPGVNAGIPAVPPYPDRA